MLKSIALLFVLACVILTFGLSNLSLNFDEMVVYPLDSDDLYSDYASPVEDNSPELPLI